MVKKYAFHFFGHFGNVKNKRIELCMKTKQLRNENITFYRLLLLLSCNQVFRISGSVYELIHWY